MYNPIYITQYVCIIQLFTSFYHGSYNLSNTITLFVGLVDSPVGTPSKVNDFEHPRSNVIIGAFRSGFSLITE